MLIYACSMVKKYIYCDLSSQVMEIREIDTADTPFVFALSLYKLYQDEKPLVISGSKCDVPLAGNNLFSIIFFSPVAQAVRYTCSNASFGRSLTCSGFDAVVFIGHSRKLSYLEIENSEVRLKVCEQLRDSSPFVFSQIVSNLKNNDVLSIGQAGERRVLLSSVYYNGEMDMGCAGLGAVFGEANLKGLVIKTAEEKIDNEKLAKKAEKKFNSSIKMRHLKLYGNNYMLQYGFRFGFLPLYNYQYRKDPRVLFLTGRVNNGKRTKLANTCAGCKINCNARSEDGTLLPSAQEIMALGLNLGFFNMESISRIVNAIREEGLSCVETGALLSYLRTVDSLDYTMPDVKNATIDEIIHLIGSKRSIGEKLGLGLKAFPDAIQMGDGTAVLCDLRGAELQAIFYSLAEKPLCYQDLFYGLSYYGNDKNKGALAYYSQLLNHLALSESVPPEHIGAIAFKSFFKRLFVRTSLVIKFYIRKLGKERLLSLVKSINLYRELAGDYVSIPEYFIKNPNSNMDDKTVAYNSIMFGYQVAKAKTESFLFSKDQSSARSE